VAVLLVEQESGNKGKEVKTLIKNKQESVMSSRTMLQKKKGNVPVDREKREIEANNEPARRMKVNRKKPIICTAGYVDFFVDFMNFFFFFLPFD